MKKDKWIVVKSKRKDEYYISLAISGGYGKGYKKSIGIGSLSELQKFNSDPINALKTECENWDTEWDRNKLKPIADKFLKKNQTKIKVSNYSLEIINKFIDKLNIFNDLKSTKSKNVVDILRYMLQKRVIEKKSIWGIFNSQEETDTELNVGKTSFYNALDYLFDNKEQILKNINNQLVSDNKRKLQVLWYDTTTAYFESFSRIGIRVPGFSKDGKFKEDQVVIGLITDENGIPLHYKLFPGNTTDSKTFIHFMLEMKRIYEIEKVVIVCDKGMSTNANIRFLEAHGIDYIISYRMKAGSKKVKEYVLKQDDYVNYGGDFKYKEQTYFSTWQNGRKNDKVRRRIISYSSSRASKDRKDRENLVNNFYKKAKNGMVSASDLNSIKKYKFFQKVNEDTLYKLNYDKIEEDEQFDGYYIYETSLLNISPSEIISIYQKQWQIEENFRVLKGTLELRPMFVWTYKHIEAYVLLSFLALVVLKYAIIQLDQLALKDSGLVEKTSVMKFIEILKTAIKISKEVNNEVISVEYDNSRKLNENLRYYETLITKYL